MSAPEPDATADAPPAPPKAPTPPSRGRPRRVTVSRIVGATVLGILGFVFLAVLPVYIEGWAGRYGITPVLPPTLLWVGGAAIAGLGALAFALKPTRAWGPAGLALSGASLAYLLVLIRNPVYTLAFRNTGVMIQYLPLLEWMLLVPLLGVAAAAVTTAEDWLRPEERIDWMFGARPSPSPAPPETD